ncbi:unnamed protein product [Laminaria digitata]
MSIHSLTLIFFMWCPLSPLPTSDTPPSSSSAPTKRAASGMFMLPFFLCIFRSLRIPYFFSRSVPYPLPLANLRHASSQFKCSYQKGSLFLSFMVTVFLAPSHASEQLLDAYDEDGLILVEVQLREGDGLYFSGLFRDLVDIVYNQESVAVVGSLKYRLCQSHAYGEGLALEPIKPPGHGPPPSGFPGGMPMEAGGYLGSSPADREAESPEELDQDMTEDVMLLSGMIREGFPTVQADAASVVAGLTATDSFRQQLSMDGASSAASAFASASARLLVETPHRAARRQASVVVANLAFDPVLRAALLASDSSKGTTTTFSSFGGGVGEVGPSHSQSQAGAFSRGLLDSLVLFAVGGVTTTTSKEQEEEIGMRRECMRALLGMSECEQARDTKAMKSLLLMTARPSGQGATDQVLMDQLAACRNVLQGHA